MMGLNVRPFLKFLENELTRFSMVEIFRVAHLREVSSKFKSDLQHPVVLGVLKNSEDKSYLGLFWGTIN